MWQTMWLPDLRNRHPVRYLAIVEALAEAIARGALRPGDRLPTHRELAWRPMARASCPTRSTAPPAPPRPGWWCWCRRCRTRPGRRWARPTSRRWPKSPANAASR
ncbi:hypothetical protein PHAMO_220091 [Magnetospirillum molischianum DSM 120]|uniref:Uncharacterized protein n=1 Tax=Magnetospirillum molischianum DSM 120 TaxID=1150626 RepID=H8FRI5_MAGML|nr:hypothetical protein PHAMO_220091 [Magnetospirillum molischianum DSM 120]